jgi:hypothetical protein
MSLDDHRWWLGPLWRVAVWLGRCLLLGLWLLAATCVGVGLWHDAELLVKMGITLAMMFLVLQWATLCWWPWDRVVMLLRRKGA